MILDANSVPEGTTLETQVCVVGAGAAGITIAREFIDSPFQVLLLESGGMDYNQETQDLYEGQSVGRPFEDLTASRLRYFGGTTNHWGGWCLPFDSIDFEPRDHFPYHGWPFSKSYLDPWYSRAQKVCQIGPYDYRPSAWGISPKMVPSPFSGPDFECKVLQTSFIHFGPAYASELRRAKQVTVYLHANAFNFDPGENGAEIKELTVKTLSGKHFTVRARIYILATGGIENARLLLASGREGRNGLGNEHDVVGRYFMVHLDYSGGVIAPAHRRMNTDFRKEFEYTKAGQKCHIVSFIGLPAAAMRRYHLPNMMIFWGYRFFPIVGAIDAFERIIHGEGPGGSTLADLSKVIGNFEGVADFAFHKLLYGDGVPIEALDVHCESEQQPNPQSRIYLGTKRDRLGMPEVVVDWRLTPEDKSKAIATIRLLGEEIGRVGFGRLHSELVRDGQWPNDFYGNAHQMGSTRMHRDPRLGVVNENCRVHSIANLYVAGSSVFPTGSANNPTLTIVALALRLADHVKKNLV